MLQGMLYGHQGVSLIPAEIVCKILKSLSFSTDFRNFRVPEITESFSHVAIAS